MEKKRRDSFTTLIFISLGYRGENNNNNKKQYHMTAICMRSFQS